jgi:hypothetical protein
VLVVVPDDLTVLTCEIQTAADLRMLLQQARSGAST